MLVPESAEDGTALAAWKDGRAGYVLALQANAGPGASVRFLGPRADVCREPINVTSRHPDLQIRLIGNFADTPFEMDGTQYASVESFWQGLKCPKGPERARVAQLNGAAARRAMLKSEYGANVSYRGSEIPVGTWAHWQLMAQACRAKFTQHPEARAALLATGDRPLIHKVRQDSRTIPGAIVAEIWMRIRKEIAAAHHPRGGRGRIGAERCDSEGSAFDDRGRLAGCVRRRARR